MTFNLRLPAGILKIQTSEKKLVKNKILDLYSSLFIHCAMIPFLVVIWMLVRSTVDGQLPSFSVLFFGYLRTPLWGPFLAYLMCDLNSKYIKSCSMIPTFFFFCCFFGLQKGSRRINFFCCLELILFFCRQCLCE